MAKRLSDIDWERDPHVDYIPHVQQNIWRVKDLLDSQGPGFCLAKWQQVTMHLGTGMTHSCHHPTAHKIPLEEIEQNPSALHNTKFKKEQRKAMLRGEKPAECDYCWRIEGNGEYSDRQAKSLEPWALPHHDEIIGMNGDEDVYPSYLEVSFGNTCNMKCTYCGPEYSSKWVEELKQQGPIALLEGTQYKQVVQGWQNLDEITYKNREFNPYIDAFWKWFPEAYKHLKVYRITGGEPLLSKETFRSMDWFIENPNLDLEFNVNSNLSVPEKLWNQFTEKLEEMISRRVVKKITIFTSAEGWGKKAEYARTDMDFALFKQRVEQLVAMKDIRCVVMAAYNIFSVDSFRQLLEWQVDLKRKYNPSHQMHQLEVTTGVPMDLENPYTQRKTDNPSHSWIVGIDIPYLRGPDFLDVQILTPDLRQLILEDYKFMMHNVANPNIIEHSGFEEYEMEKLKRISMHVLNYKNRDNKQTVMRRAKFYDFVNQMDKRRNTNFLETFPAYADFYENCRQCKEKLLNNDYTLDE